ncbi:hypothetical protein ACSO1_19040 [Acinetobacter calcoaceticus]|nr:hypothetical protein ACSO1_19040 [Acinetobacter calcoaceticus]
MTFLQSITSTKRLKLTLSHFPEKIKAIESLQTNENAYSKVAIQYKLVFKRPNSQIRPCHILKVIRVKNDSK